MAGPNEVPAGMLTSNTGFFLSLLWLLSHSYRVTGALVAGLELKPETSPLLDSHSLEKVILIRGTFFDSIVLSLLQGSVVHEQIQTVNSNPPPPPGSVRVELSRPVIAEHDG